MGVPSSAGVPPFPSYPSGASASASGWPPAPAFQYDPHAFPAPPAPADLLSDSDNRFWDDDHPLLDPSAPPLSLDLLRSEYRCMVEYVCSSFPQVAGVPPVAPPPWTPFELFFARATLASQSLSFN